MFGYGVASRERAAVELESKSSRGFWRNDQGRGFVFSAGERGIAFERRRMMRVPSIFGPRVRVEVQGFR